MSLAQPEEQFRGFEIKYHFERSIRDFNTSQTTLWSRMSKMQAFGLLWAFTLALAHGAEDIEFDLFIRDIMVFWRLRAPTLIVQGDLPQLCERTDWVLCLPSEDWEKEELAEQLATMNMQSRQDGVILVGREGHNKLLEHPAVKDVWTSNCPNFIPASYRDNIKLRLDSNIVFYEETSKIEYELYDMYAIKDGPPIIEKLGKWDTESGIQILSGVNRWDRRTDLGGAPFINAVLQYGIYASFLRDKNGSITGSTGLAQDHLFYITENLNLTVETVEAQRNFKVYKNGSYGGGIGMLQRGEVDVCSLGHTVKLQITNAIDLPLPAHREPMALIAALPKGTYAKFWVYVRVFGFNQWIIFMALLMLVVIGVTCINTSAKDASDQASNTKKGGNMALKRHSTSAGFALVYLYTLQMGSHTNSKQVSLRLLTMTTSLLTLLLFAYYTTDITAEMTSGPPEIPIKNFGDVVHHDYKVVTDTVYYEKMLAGAERGTSKNEVYQNNFERRKNWEEAMREIINDDKSLYYATFSSQFGQTPSQKALGDQTFALRVDDDTIAASISLGLQKDSEFLQIFNHYSLKAMESGFSKRIFRKYHMDLYTKESFEMMGAQPLGYDSVMFCFICLAIGMVVSILKGMLEYVTRKLTKEP